MCHKIINKFFFDVLYRYSVNLFAYLAFDPVIHFTVRTEIHPVSFSGRPCKFSKINCIQALSLSCIVIHHRFKDIRKSNTLTYKVFNTVCVLSLPAARYPIHLCRYSAEHIIKHSIINLSFPRIHFFLGYTLNNSVKKSSMCNSSRIFSRCAGKVYELFCYGRHHCFQTDIRKIFMYSGSICISLSVIQIFHRSWAKVFHDQFCCCFECLIMFS